MGDVQGITNEGKEDELSFWRDLISKSDPAWLASRFDRKREVSPVIVENVKPRGVPLKALDVGCGPLAPVVGGVLNGTPVTLVGLDPLARDYRELHAKAGVHANFDIVKGTAETLSSVFPSDSFDFVNSDNALDHCFDPVASLKNMFNVLKPGGILRIRVFVNEGETAGYGGFHQWNFDTVHDRVVTWNPNAIHLLDNILPGAPYSFVKDHEIIRMEQLHRDTLIFRVAKVDRSSHRFHDVHDVVSVADIPEVNCLLMEKGPRFDDHHNLFVHVFPKDKSTLPEGQDMIPISFSTHNRGDRFFVRLPEGVERLRVGQYYTTQRDGQTHYTNTWDLSITRTANR